MAESELQNLLKPFYQRASEAEERLAKLEVSLARDKDCANEEYLKKLSTLESELERTKGELASEREKAKKYELENEKLQYRITHLVRAVRENDPKSAT